MYFVTYEQGGKQIIGVLTSDREKIIPLQKAEQTLLGSTDLPDTLVDLIKHGDRLLTKVKKLYRLVEEEGHPIEVIPKTEVKLKAPIPRPKKNIFCLGKNYKEHAFEFEKTKDENKAIPKFPVIFSKVPTSVIGPGDPINCHSRVTSEIDYEIELGVVIGREGTNIRKEDVGGYIFGYTIINDVTARDLQRNHMQWLRGKSLNTFAPMGPYLVHKEAVPAPDNLDVVCKVNGEVRQKANTKDLLFDIPYIVSTLSQGMTLEPGDIIATGTPAGVGIGFDPPKFLKAGDVIEMEISGLGLLQNKVV